MLKTRLGLLVQRFSRPAADTAPARARSEDVSAEQWSTMTREDGGVWRDNSLYRARSLLVDRAVQSESEMTTKTVAENCLALTADALNQRHSPDNDEATPTISQTSVQALNDDVMIEEEFRSGVMLQRRDSYQRAIMHADNLSQPTDLEAESTAYVAVDEIAQYTLDTVCELEEPDVDDALKKPGLPVETTDKVDKAIHSHEENIDEILECDEEAGMKDTSFTRADILDSGSDELDVAVAEESLIDRQTETSRSPSASVDDDLTVYTDENSHLAAVTSVCRESEDSRLPHPSSPSEHDLGDAVWISGTTGDIALQDCTADEVKQPIRDVQEDDVSVHVLTTLDQSEDRYSSVSQPSPSPPPPPPIDVIAVDITGQRLSDDGRRDVDEHQSNRDDEYCHSPLGGAMPESADSSVIEFVFP